MYNRGNIILVPFPFTDLSRTKLRPALIINDDKLKSGDVAVVFISSLLPRKSVKTDFVLLKDDFDFKRTNLRATSVFKVGKIATLDKKIILGKLGQITPRIQKEIDKRLKTFLNLT